MTIIQANTAITPDQAAINVNSLDGSLAPRAIEGPTLKPLELGNWQTEDALIDKLQELKLLSKEYLYSAAPASLLPTVLQHGTYMLNPDSRQPEPHIYCCECVENKCRFFLPQVGAIGELDRRISIWPHVNHHSGNGVLLIVWDRSKLEQSRDPEAMSPAAFKFKDPSHRLGAIKCILNFTDL